MNEHEYEPVRGLPAQLPADEPILWQGAPVWRALARRAMHVRQLAIYFAALVLWGIAGGLRGGAPLVQIGLSSLRLAGLATVALGLLTAYAWLASRTTVYTITSRRVVMRIGVALPITFQIPFRQIGSAGVRILPNGTGDIALSLLSGQRIAYLMLWPHARPWKFKRCEPSLRAVPEAAAVAQVLGRALAASALQPAATVPMPAPVGNADDARIAATA